MTGRPALVDARGVPVALGAELGRGGEGAVYEIQGASDLVAKVYHHALAPEKAAKFRAMAALSAEPWTKVAAWPRGTVHETPGGTASAVRGIIMPKVTGHLELHHLYSPAQRRVDFPGADWRFLVRTARNAAAAVSSIHQAGHVIGDVNQKNFVVSETAIVRLLDSDSFQVWDGRRWHECGVGVSHFTPPELQGVSFRGVVRTKQHDAFGLAVLVFHLLFMGRHPFTGVYSGRDMELEEAIRSFRFAYSERAPGLGIKPPPASLPLAAASASVARYFERAFGPDAPRRGDRPSAAEWVTALDTLAAETIACPSFKGHTFHRGLAGCPWCAIETAGGPNFFVTTVLAATGGAFNLAAVWAEIMAVPAPPDTVGVQAPALGQGQVVSGGVPIPRRMRVVALASRGTGWTALAVLCAVVFGAPLVDPVAWLSGALILWFALRSANKLPAEKKRREAAAHAAKVAWEGAHERAVRALQEERGQFESERQRLNSKRAEYLSLDDGKRQALAQLERDRQRNQLTRHLERRLIRRAKISGIGPARVDALASFGIETAADVNTRDVQRVPGFGPTLARNLMAWRHTCEATFRFNPALGVQQADIQRVEHDFARKRRDLEAVLRGGAHELRRLRARGEQRKAALTGEMEALVRDVHRTGADLALV